jgi:ATP-dependent DNA helicase RecQ
MREYATTTGCRMEFLRRQLDDERAEPCGRCDNCAGARHTSEVSAASLEAARAALGRPGVEIEPRKMWPTGLDAAGIGLKGRIAPAEQAEAGRALGRLSDIGWGNRLRPLFAEGALDQPVPSEAVDAVVQVLADGAKGPGGWASGAPDAPDRPVGVVAMPSLRHGTLVQSLAARIADVGRMPLLGTLGYAGGEGPGAVPRSNSAQRVRALHDAFVLPPELAAALQAAPGPVLLVDDMMDTGWTLAMAARLLRRAGAAAVFPLVLAVQG